MLTATTAWAFKTETAVTYTVSYSNSTITIRNGSTTTASWTAKSSGVAHYWKANDSHNLSSGMTVKPSADVSVTGGSPATTTSTTFTFTTSGNTAITGVTFKNGNNDVAASSTSSEPGTTFTVTLASGKGFTNFTVTYGYISGSCGTSATWSLAKQNGQYTALTIGGSGAMSNYSAGTTPWGTDVTTATIGSNITSIGNNAFNGCTALTRVNVQKTNGLVTLSSGAFTGCNALATIVAPTPALAVGYQTATNWNAHASKLRVALSSYLFAATDEGGTAAYAITSETDLRNLAAVVNAGGGEAVRDRTIRQTANITLNGTFTPMGYDTDNNWKKGTYDGGGYTISGLNVNYYIDQYAWHGLFGYVFESTVKNVVLINPSFPNNDHSAALIGKLDAGTAMNCYAYGTSTLIRSQAGVHGSNTVTNVGRARKVTLGSGVTVSPAATDIANGFVYNNESYYREGLALTLSSNTTAPTGYTQTYSANGDAISGQTYTVNSTDGDVTVSLGALIALSGSCGTDATWTMTDEDGNGSFETLTISGTGAMTEYTTLDNRPWHDDRTAITTVNIGDGVTTIGNSSFSDCKALTSIEIPSSVTSIGDWSFDGCKALTSVTIYAPSLTYYGDNAFGSNASGRKIYVFSDCVDTYKSGWSGYASDIEPITLAANEGATGEYWTTYYNDMADAKAPDGTQVFKADLDGTTMTLTPIADGIISRGQGVVMKSTTATVQPLHSATASADGYSDNDLQGTMTRIANPGNAYVLNKKDSHGVGFYRLSDTGHIGAHKAYLTYTAPASAPAREFFGFSGDDTTPLLSPEGDENGASPRGGLEGVSWYTISGVRLQGKPTVSGMYIHNGRKEVLK